MTVKEALLQSGLSQAEAEILLSSLLKQNRAWIFSHDSLELSLDDEKIFLEHCERRRGGEPLAYITGEKEFYGRMFKVDARALIPKECTEHLIDDVKIFLENPKDQIHEIDSGIVSWTQVLKKEKPKIIVDIGTGSGCIALTLALELPNLILLATDISVDALSLAKENAKKLGVNDINFFKGSVLDTIKNLREPFLIVSNPPYLSRESKEIQKEVFDFEPHIALFAENEGRAIIKQITTGASKHPYCVGWIIECAEDQAA